jgi:hypothetical protein
MEVGYIGNRSIKLGLDRPLNFTPVEHLSVAPVRDQGAIDRLSASVANPFAGLLPGTGLNGSVVSRAQLLARFPHFTGATLNGGSDGSSYSHMLMVRSEKRFSHGLQLQASFQYSRVIQRMSRLNDGDTVLEKRIAVEDRPLRLVVNGTYSLPFGRGRRFGASANRFLNAVIGGWSGAGFYSFQSGIPVQWGNVIYYGGDLGWRPGNVDRAFETTRFNTNSREQLAQNRRTFPTAFSDLRGGILNNFDLSVIKEFPVVERLRLQYRCEFFNALNHPLFDLPDVNPTSSTFGRVQNQYNLPRRIQMALRLVW